MLFLFHRWNEATYYDNNDWPGSYGMNIKRSDSVGSWIASTVDLVRFLVHFDGSDSKPDLISKATYNLMTTQSNCANCQSHNYAKGWNVDQFGSMWHTGFIPGTGSYLAK